MSTLVLVTATGPVVADATEPIVHAEDLGLLRGEAVFETSRVIGGRPVDLAAHLDRLARSASAVDVTLPEPAALTAAVRCAIDAGDGPDGVLRLVATKGAPGVAPVRFALLTPLPGGLDDVRRLGIEAVTLTLGLPAALRAQAPWLLGGVKSTAYAVPMAAQRAAQHAGAQDAIWVSADGEVLEGLTSTVLVVFGDRLVTPPAAELGLLPGLTLARIRRFTEVHERHVLLAELAAATELLLVSSVRGAAPVTRLDGRAFPIGRVGTTLPAALETDLRREP